MNHFDDRASYFAMLHQQAQFAAMQDANKQADVSSTAYGGVYTSFVNLAALQADV